MTTITLEYAAPMIKEAASEDYQPIFANKGAGASIEAQAKVAGVKENAGARGPAENGGAGTAMRNAASPYSWTAEAEATA